MKNIIKKIKENDFLRFTINFFKVIFSIFAIIIILTVAVQRFSNNNLSIGGYRLFTIISDSMKPEYVVGDMLLSKTTPMEEIKKGDDVVYNGLVDDFAGKTVVHRVISARKTNGEYVFTTKGLANFIEDPVVKEDQIMGKIIYKTRVLSFISKVVNNIYGFYFVILLPFTVIIFVEIVKAVDEKKQEKEKEKEQKKKKDDEEVL